MKTSTSLILTVLLILTGIVGCNSRTKNATGSDNSAKPLEVREVGFDSKRNSQPMRIRDVGFDSKRSSSQPQEVREVGFILKRGSQPQQVREVAYNSNRGSEPQEVREFGFDSKRGSHPQEVREDADDSNWDSEPQEQEESDFDYDSDWDSEPQEQEESEVADDDSLRSYDKQGAMILDLLDKSQNINQAFGRPRPLEPPSQVYKTGSSTRTQSNILAALPKGHPLPKGTTDADYVQWVVDTIDFYKTNLMKSMNFPDIQPVGVNPIGDIIGLVQAENAMQDATKKIVVFAQLLNQLDVSKCPEDFRAIYTEYARKNLVLANGMYHLINEGIGLLDFLVVGLQDDYTKDIDKVEEELFSLAKNKYGATIPEH